MEDNKEPADTGKARRRMIEGGSDWEEANIYTFLIIINFIILICTHVVYVVFIFTMFGFLFYHVKFTTFISPFLPFIGFLVFIVSFILMLSLPYHLTFNKSGFFLLNFFTHFCIVSLSCNQYCFFFILCLFASSQNRMKIV
jgi:hypothetical protein